MKCEICGKNEVTFVYRSNINGNITERHLCAQCAAERGYSRKLQESRERLMRSFWDDSPFGIMPRSLFALPGTGSRFFGEDLLEDFFRDMPALTAQPEEKAAAAPAEKESLVEEQEQSRFSRLRKLNALRLAMKKAVRKEEFEEAARLRDEIRALEQEHKESA